MEVFLTLSIKSTSHENRWIKKETKFVMPLHLTLILIEKSVKQLKLYLLLNCTCWNCYQLNPDCPHSNREVTLGFKFNDRNFVMNTTFRTAVAGFRRSCIGQGHLVYCKYGSYVQKLLASFILVHYFCERRTGLYGRCILNLVTFSHQQCASQCQGL